MRKEAKKRHQNSKIIKIQKSSKFKNHQNSKIIKIQKKILYQNSLFFCGQAPSCMLSMDSHLFVFVFLFLLAMDSLLAYLWPILSCIFTAVGTTGHTYYLLIFVCCIFTVVGTRGHDSCLLLRMCCIFTARCLQGSDLCRRADSVT